MSDPCPRSPNKLSGEAACPRSVQTGVQRWLLAFAGILCVALGVVGVFVPGLPTTVFVILASYCFTRSCPWLEDRLLRNRLFARSMRYVDGDLVLSTGQRVAISCVIVLFTGSSALLLSWGGGVAFGWIVAVVCFGLIGIVAVAYWRRSPRSASRLTTG